MILPIPPIQIPPQAAPQAVAPPAMPPVVPPVVPAPAPVPAPRVVAMPEIKPPAEAGISLDIAKRAQRIYKGEAKAMAEAASKPAVGTQAPTSSRWGKA